MTLSRVLSKDPNGAKFSGPGVGTDNWLPAGTRVGTTDYAVTHILLVDASNNPLIVAVDLDSGAGTANRAGFALLVPASGGPAVVPGDATNGLKVQLPAGGIALDAATLAALESITIGTALPAGTAVVGKVGIDQTTPGTTDSVSVKKTSLTGSAPTFATVGTSSAEAVPVNANRKGLVLVNTSANTISLAFGAAAVLNSGITLAAGAAYTMGEYDFTTAQVRAIASGAGSNLAVQEFV